VTAAVLEFADTSKAYGGLRPLRIAALRVAAGDRVAILGFDQPAAEVFVNLATGATLPDAGAVSILGRPTHAITTARNGSPRSIDSGSSPSARCCSTRSP